MYFSERVTLSNIDWNNEDHVSSLTAHKLRLYLKQHNLQVSGGKAALVARVLRYKRVDNDATSDSELQSSDSEDDAQSDSLEMSDFIEHSCRMRYNTKQVKDSGIFPGGWGGGAS